MNKDEWVEVVLSELAVVSEQIGLTVKHLNLSHALDAIGGGAGICYSLHGSDGHQVAAVSRYDENPDTTVVFLTIYGQAELHEPISSMAERIAANTNTTLNRQGALSVH